MRLFSSEYTKKNRGFILNECIVFKLGLLSQLETIERGSVNGSGIANK